MIRNITGADDALSQRLAGRMATALFVGGGLGTIIATLLPAHEGLSRTGVVAVGILALLVGLASWYLPWHRWSERTTLWLVPLAFGLIAVANHFADAEPFRYGIFFIVSFAWIGFAHRPGTSLFFTPLLLLAYLLPLFSTGNATPAALASTVMLAPICIAIGESMSWISERLRVAEIDLRRRHGDARFRSLIQNSSDVISILEPDLTIRYETPSIERVLGHAVEDRIGRSLLDLVHPGDAVAVRKALEQVVTSEGSERRFEHRVHHADGSWHMVQAIAKNLIEVEAVGGVVVNYRDITEQKALEEQLRRQAFEDELTGLPNRHLFTDRLEHAIAFLGRQSLPIAVLFIDLDDFKTVNDSLGHDAGDRLLVEAGHRIRRCLRSVDTVARLGGDEFAVLLEDVEPDAPAAAATRILAALREPIRVHRQQLTVGASIGIATAHSPKQTVIDLLRNADLAMYSAKDNGKGRFEVFRPKLQRAAATRLRLKADLEHALDDDQFQLRYQPLVNLASGDLVGMEALVRWHHPRRGEILPGDFISITEESGVILPLGRWVLHEACRQARAWHLDGLTPEPIGISVNLSARQLEDPGLPDEVSAALESSGLEPGLLTLEITESVLMHDTKLTQASLHRLKALGVRIVIDDFGTGYSSLSYLRRFPIDGIKIDRSFIDAVDTDREEADLVGSIIALSHRLKLETVAEGVERWSQLARLRTLGAQLGQGYYLSVPLTPSEVAVYARDFALNRGLAPDGYASAIN
jgi:diguanylate cyclase (GGDEF)-like protein/PAS domain S-box-containing protein